MINRLQDLLHDKIHYTTSEQTFNFSPRNVLRHNICYPKICLPSVCHSEHSRVKPKRFEISKYALHQYRYGAGPVQITVRASLMIIWERME